jgi:hypothetical protein
VSALAPVSGGPITTLTTAAADVLLAQHVRILVAPACVEGDAGAYSCAGTTVDGAPIGVTASGTPMQMTVTVGGATLFQGEVDSVIQQAAQVTP